MTPRGTPVTSRSHGSRWPTSTRVADNKRPDSRRRGPASRPGASARGRSRPARITAREPRRKSPRAQAESVGHGLAEPIRRVLAASTAQQSEERLGFTARRAAILAAVICVLTLTIAGPVRTYFAQRTEMKQLAASEQALREQIAELESQKAKLADPVYIAAQARERLGFVMPGDIPYQVQLPPGSEAPPEAGPQTDTPHGPPPAPSPEPPAPGAGPPPPPPGEPGPPPPPPPGG